VSPRGRTMPTMLGIRSHTGYRWEAAPTIAGNWPRPPGSGCALNADYRVDSQRLLGQAGSQAGSSSADEGLHDARLIVPALNLITVPEGSHDGSGLSRVFRTDIPCASRTRVAPVK
jgi:hypothetical protein